MRLWTVVFLAASLGVSFGCSFEGGGQPLVWPNAVREGDTVAVVVDANYTPLAGGDSLERHDLSIDNLKIRLDHARLSEAVEVDPRAVVGGAALPAALLERSHPGSTVTIALFDMPPLGLMLPVDNISVELVVDDQPVWSPLAIAGSLDLIEGVGEPVEFYPLNLEESLSPRPALRVRLNPDLMEEHTTIGAIGFRVDVSSDSVSDPEAFVVGDGAGGVALVGPAEPQVPGHWAFRVTLVHPTGFAYYHATDELAGTGPFVDIAFTKTRPFKTSDFTIRDLYITDTDGRLVYERGPDNSMGSVRLYARANR